MTVINDKGAFMRKGLTFLELNTDRGFWATKLAQ